MNKLKDDEENSLPLCLETLSLPRDVFCSFPILGSVLRITSSQCDEKFDINFVKSGKWAKNFNLKCVTYSGLWHAELMTSTKLSYLPKDNTTVLQRERLHEKRLSGKWSWMPLTCFPSPSKLTETEFPNVALSSLMHVLTHPQAIAKFKCVVRVVAIHPWEADNFRSRDGHYRIIRLTLEDPTARIHAYLYGDDGATFFENPDSTSSMTRKRNKLLGISESDGEAGRNPPWIDCCLKSYYTDKNEQWKTRVYAIFATRFVG